MEYHVHRKVPAAVAEAIAVQGEVSEDTAILDVGTGAGSLALSLSRHSRRVTGIDVSEPLLDRARTDALRTGSRAVFRRSSGNQLIFSGERYDIVTLCQAFHWLDAGCVTCGLHRVLGAHGALFIVESKVGLPKEHPMRRNLRFGTPVSQPMAAECYAHALRYDRLFECMRRVAPSLRFTRLTLFRQRRRFDFGFARAFFFDHQVAPFFHGSADPWSALKAAFVAAAPEHLYGKAYWFVAKYKMHGRRWPVPPMMPEWIDLS